VTVKHKIKSTEKQCRRIILACVVAVGSVIVDIYFACEMRATQTNDGFVWLSSGEGTSKKGIWKFLLFSAKKLEPRATSSLL